MRHLVELVRDIAEERDFGGLSDDFFPALRRSPWLPSLTCAAALLARFFAGARSGYFGSSGEAPSRLAC